MNGPGPEEKLCPFCAEVIKRAAVRCRYCRSDLPVEAVSRHGFAVVPPAVVDPLDAYFEADFGDFGSEPGDAVDLDVVEPGSPVLSAAPDVEPRRWNSAAVALAIACVLLLTGCVQLVLRGSASHPASGTTHAATSSYRDDAMSAAVENAVTVLSYSYKTLVRDEENARAVMSPDFVADYEKVMAEATPKAVKARLTLTASVVATSLVSIDARRAVALLFVNAVSTAEDSPKRHLDEKRVLMTMTRKDGEWIVSKIDAF